MAGCSHLVFTPQQPEQAKIMNSVYEEGRFQNSEIRYVNSIGKLWEITKRYLTAKREQPVPREPVPVTEITPQQLAESAEDSLYRLGHSTVLMKLSGHYLLTDPVFSERASPVSWAGPKRFHQSPISLEALPSLGVVIISHDHYDHLDRATVIALADKTERFLTPLGVGQRLLDWGVKAEKVIELDWWQGYRFADIELIATPSQHFSGRGLSDKDKTLWASWVIRSEQQKLFFSGDSGYFSGFVEIGRRYGPFDLTMIETGAYNELWSEIHMHAQESVHPQESVQAHVDLQGRVMIPVHNGTFDLALHDWNEPMQLVSAAAEKAGVTLLQPQFGEKVSLEKPETLSVSWW